MEYTVRTVQKIGVSGYENALNKIIAEMTAQDWNVQQLIGDGAQGFAILFAREKGSK